MKIITENKTSSQASINNFVNQVDFTLPEGFIAFYNRTDGAEMKSSSGRYFIIWPIMDLFKFNVEYNVSTYAPRFFLFGTDGGDSAYCFDKGLGHIYELPFIGMDDSEAILLCRTFDELLKL